MPPFVAFQFKRFVGKKEIYYIRQTSIVKTDLPLFYFQNYNVYWKDHTKML